MGNRIQRIYHLTVKIRRQHWQLFVFVPLVLISGVVTAGKITKMSANPAKAAVVLGSSSSRSSPPAKFSVSPQPSSTGPSRRLNPPTFTANPSTPAPAPDPGANFGIATGGGLPYLSASDLNTSMEGIRALGVRWVRFDVDWAQIQRDSSFTYDWVSTDRVVAALRANGLNGLGIINSTPSWARVPECATRYDCRPSDPAAYASFAGLVAARYAPQGIHTWEIWNEPNIADSWLPIPSTLIYSQMLILSYRSIKLADSRSIVLTGGMASTPTDGSNLSSRDFLSGIYANGGQGNFDAVSDHPYTRPFLPTFVSIWSAWQQMANTQLSLRSIMVANGDANKKIWITEYGAPTDGPGSAAASGLTMSEQYDHHETESLQAETVTQALDLYKTYSWAGPLFWYSYKDKGISRDTAENFYGLLRADGSKKPAYYTFQNAIANYYK